MGLCEVLRPRKGGVVEIDTLALCYSDVEAARQWRTKTFVCIQCDLPNWDARQLSDIALKFPSAEEPTILLSDRSKRQ